ncbi:MAG: DUF4340 domain-containing protein [Candidatus Poribacteria bacterium]|nr:DUF4340 domain-containing protein [Candidatus Poribacteria bacterium]
MKTKQLFILGAIFVVLASVVLLFENPFGQSEYEKKVETAMPLFPNFNEEQVVKIEITATGETTTLSKQSGNWVVASMDNYPADSEGVTELLAKVAEFKNTQRVSNNPEKQSEFEVDNTGVEAKLMDTSDKVLAHLFVGKTTPGFLSSYVRPADANEVYVAQGYLQSVFDKGTRTWKDRTIFNFNKGIVTQLNIVSPEETVELRLDVDGAWQMLKPVAAAAKATEIDTLLTTFSGLDTDDFAAATDALAAYGLDTPQSTISAVLNDGTMATLHIGKEEEGKLYVKRDDTETVFRLFKANVDQLIKKSETLKAEEAATEVETEQGGLP